MPKIDAKNAAKKSASAPAKATKKKPKATSRVTSNRTAGLRKKRVVAHGPPGSGKTFFAASLSKSWPKSLPAKKWTKLSDVLWVPFDSGALDGLLEQKIEVPSIDVDAILEEEDVLGALEEITDIVYDESPEIVVVDTVSKLDKEFLGFWNENAPLAKGGAKDGYAIYREVLATHRRFHANFDALPCDVIFLCHSKPRPESADRKQRAGGLPGMSDIDMDLTGQALNIYRQDSSLVVSIEAVPVGNGKFQRFAWTTPHKGFEAKNRFQVSLDEKEPAHLGKMYAKIEGVLS